MKFYRNESIELIAEERLAKYEQELGRRLSVPIDIELFGDLVLGLSILWETLEELPGEVVLAGLQPARRRIIMNEGRKDELESKPGLRRLTQGHEMGHWDLFVEQAELDHPTLFETAVDSLFAYRSSPVGEVQVMNCLLACEEGRELVRQINARADNPNEKRSVNRYAAALLMPRTMIVEDAKSIDRTEWKPLYRLAERYDVTISALRVRLEQLNLLYVDNATGRLYPSREVAHGQLTLL
jgi:hypothetical protein